MELPTPLKRIKAKLTLVWHIITARQFVCVMNVGKTDFGVPETGKEHEPYIQTRVLIQAYSSKPFIGEAIQELEKHFPMPEKRLKEILDSLAGASTNMQNSPGLFSNSNEREVIN